MKMSTLQHLSINLIEEQKHTSCYSANQITEDKAIFPGDDDKSPGCWQQRRQRNQGMHVMRYVFIASVSWTTSGTS